jgi:hypothetical protein
VNCCVVWLVVVHGAVCELFFCGLFCVLLFLFVNCFALCCVFVSCFAFCCLF